MSLLALESLGVLSKAFSACCAALHPHCYYYGLEGGASVPSQRLDPSSQNNGLLTLIRPRRCAITSSSSHRPCQTFCVCQKMLSLSPSLRRSASLADELECSCKHLCANKANIIREQLHAHLRLACGCFFCTKTVGRLPVYHMITLRSPGHRLWTSRIACARLSCVRIALPSLLRFRQCGALFCFVGIAGP